MDVEDAAKVQNLPVESKWENVSKRTKLQSIKRLN